MLSPTLITVALAAAMIGALAGVLGSFLVLRGQSLLGDVIAHASLPGVVAGFLITGGRGFVAILAGALVAGALAGLSVQALRRWAGVKSDAALGVVLSLFFALGVVLLTLAQTRGGSAGLTVFLFGQAASVLRADLAPMALVGAGVLVTLALFWKEFHLVAFDPEAARAQGLPVAWLESLLTLLTAVTIVLGLSLAGVVLMVAMLIAPAVAARQWVRSLAPMVVLAAGLGVVAGVSGAVLSALGPGVATGPVMVLIACSLAALSVLVSPRRGLLARWLERKRVVQALRVELGLRGMIKQRTDHANPAYGADKA
ncbi:MAG: metal ABC transporter permease, partial [Rhodobacteraceae bacterium]|nr:metal ABC transporter permease [Paracoccaceae bacterium]